MADSEEFAEFETDEATFDAMMEEAEPVDLISPPGRVVVLSAARDVITFANGLPVTINAATSTVSQEARLSPIRGQPIRQEPRVEQVAS